MATKSGVSSGYGNHFYNSSLVIAQNLGTPFPKAVHWLFCIIHCQPFEMGGQVSEAVILFNLASLSFYFVDEKILTKNVERMSSSKLLNAKLMCDLRE